MFDVVMIGPFPEDVAHIKGGVQASVYGLARALKNQPGVTSVQGISIPIKAHSWKEPRSAVLDGIPVTYLNLPSRFLISGALHVPAILNKMRVLKRPVAHIHGTGMLQALLCVMLRMKSIPFIWTLHGITEKETLQRFRDRKSPGNLARYLLYTCIERLTLRLTKQVIVDTPYVREEITRKDVHVIPQGIFIDEFAALADAPRNEQLIACIGVIDPRKGHLQTIEAFALLQAKQPEARLVIAGSLTDAGYLEQMKQRVAALGMDNFITLAVQQPRAVILEYLARAQLFALHSREESQGIALCEALACGLPVVATRVGGIPFVVTDNVDGLLVEYGDIHGFAAALQQLLTDDALRTRMAAQAKISGRNFSWNHIAARVLDVYKAA